MLTRLTILLAWVTFLLPYIGVNDSFHFLVKTIPSSLSKYAVICTALYFMSTGLSFHISAWGRQDFLHFVVDICVMGAIMGGWASHPHPTADNPGASLYHPLHTSLYNTICTTLLLYLIITDYYVMLTWLSFDIHSFYIKMPFTMLVILYIS